MQCPRDGLTFSVLMDLRGQWEVSSDSIQISFLSVKTNRADLLESRDLGVVPSERPFVLSQCSLCHGGVLYKAASPSSPGGSEH